VQRRADDALLKEARLVGRALAMAKKKRGPFQIHATSQASWPALWRRQVSFRRVGRSAAGAELAMKIEKNIASVRKRQYAAAAAEPPRWTRRTVDG
jgi:hypothetical protein